MRWLLFLVALSASADCIPRTLLRAGGPIYGAAVDNGVLYYSIFGQRTIQRVDETTGQSAPFFTLDDPYTPWTVRDGTVVFPPKVPSVGRVSRVQDGFLYWIESDNALRRQSLGGGAVEIIAVGLPANISGIDQVTRDSVILSTTSPFDPNVASASVLRVPLSGAPVETIYEATVPGYAPAMSLAAMVAGRTTYIVRTVTQHFFWTTSTLIVRRDGVARERYGAPNSPLAILAADEDDITLGQWIDAGGMRQIERLCAASPRSRAAAR